MTKTIVIVLLSIAPLVLAGYLLHVFLVRAAGAAQQESAGMINNDLMRTCHDAHIRTMLNSSPSEIQPPISKDDAAELYAMMAVRFKAWTGLALKDFDA